MNEKLRIQIEADVSQLEKEMAKVSKAIGRAENELKDAVIVSRGYEKAQAELNGELKAGTITQEQYRKGLERLQRDEKESQLEVKRLRNELSGLKREQRDLGGSTGKLGGEINTLGKNTKANAVPAMMSFSQVIQDAPYGIQGVANNIQQLTAQMGYLSASSGGAGGALKAMAGSLIGPAGILMGVSLVTTALVTYGDKIFAAVGATNALAKATKDYMGEAMAEVSQLQVLVDIANDHEASIIARRRAIDEINDKYSGYLGNLDLEKIKTDKVKASIDDLTRSLIQQAQVEGLQDVIGEETLKAAEKTTELQIKQREGYQQIQKELAKMDKTGYWGKVIRDSDDVIGSLALIQKTGEEIPAGLRSAVGGYQEVLNKIEEVEKETANALKPYQELQKALQEQIFNVTVTPEFSQEEIVVKGAKADPVKIPVKFDLSEENLLNSDEIAALTDQIALDMKLPEELNNAALLSDMNKREAEFFAASEEGWAAYTEKMGLTAEQNAQYANMMGQAFASLSSQMIDSLLEGTFSLEEFAKSIISTLGKIVAQMAATTIVEKIIGKGNIAADAGVAMANAGVAATSAAAAMGPAGFFALPGLLASSTAMVGSFYGGLAAFKDGGVVGGHSYYGDKILARVNSGEAILNQAQQKAVWGQMNSPAGDRGSADLRVGGYIEASGETLRVIIDRADQRRGRIT